MPNSHVLKKFIRPLAQPYQFLEAEELDLDARPPAPPADLSGGPPAAQSFEAPAAEEREPLDEARPAPSVSVADNPIRYAQVQADAILNTAKTQAAEIRALEKAKLQQELDQIREGARQEGFREGYAQGLASASDENRRYREMLELQALRKTEEFIEQASQARDELIDATKRDMCELATAVAEKVVRVSLRSSSGVIAKMIQSATEKLKRREWVHIYISASDAKGMAQAPPALANALAPLSDHIKIVPMSNEEPGTCIIEMPDAIIDASASTQIANLRAVLEDVPPDDPPSAGGFGRRAGDL